MPGVPDGIKQYIAMDKKIEAYKKLVAAYEKEEKLMRWSRARQII
jgi:hypothetical protein